MSHELLRKAKEAVQIARRAGAQGARASVYRGRESEVRWRDGKLDSLRESTTMGVGIALYVDGRYSGHSTNDLRPQALETFVTDAVGMTRLLTEDPHRSLPDPEFYQDMLTRDLKMVDAHGMAAVTSINRRRNAAAIEEAMRVAPGAERIISVETACEDNEYEQALVASNGMEGTKATTGFSMSAQVTLRDAGDQRRADYWYTFSRQRDRVLSAEAVARLALRRATEALGAGPMKGGEYPVVVENRVASNPIGLLLGALDGGSVQQQQSFLADRLGQQIASPKLSITDEPHLPGGGGSRTFDSEGMAARRFPLIQRGVLRNFFLDTYYASKLGMRPTTGGSSNLVYDLGTRDLEQLLAAMGRGILITDFVGGNSNSTTGDFSAGIHGHWIENGRRVRPLAEMNISGNALEIWMKLQEVGNDPYLNSSNRRPSLRFDALTFSGV